uniref:Mothers against decapentaplegic homolog n=1 Tax=Chelydra serpentina TaxID=8475 RepID=A0A8C3TB48_CHESE
SQGLWGRGCPAGAAEGGGCSPAAPCQDGGPRRGGGFVPAPAAGARGGESRPGRRCRRPGPRPGRAGTWGSLARHLTPLSPRRRARHPMFRSRRAGLVRRLWRHRCGAPGPEDGPGALKPAAHALFRKLKDEELELLVQAVESRGAGQSGCVWVARGELRGSKQGLPPQVLICRLYRWPDLRHPHELKRLTCCQSFGGCGEGAALCCNPHHLSRLAVPETPPPPYSKISPFSCPWTEMSERPNSSHPESDPGLAWSTTRDGCWCRLAYWEHRTRVGRLYAVHETSVNIFCELPQGSGFSLGQLQAERRSAAVRRARSKIGRGLLLSRERDGVWAYNRSEHPIFASSPTLGPPGARGPPVRKVLPGYSLQVFDYERAGGQAGWRRPGDGPCDPNSIRISFAKGWGPCYSRQFITACPCWLEILLTKPR